MLQKNSTLAIIDNSGAKFGRCIHIYNGYRKRYARMGDMVLLSLTKVKPGKKIGKTELKKGMVFKGVVVRTKVSIKYNSNKRILFKQNGAVLISAKNKFAGLRIFGPVLHEFRYTKYLRLTSIAAGVVK
jgi:large subunit ribosomal protein L14